MLTSYSVFADSEFYVSPNGNDKNPGTKAKPFKTLEVARDALRRKGQRAKGKKNVVYLRSGTYRLMKAFELNEKDSNTTYKAYKNEKVSITGSVSIPVSKVKKLTDKTVLYRLPVERKGTVYEAVINFVLCRSTCWKFISYSPI